MYQIYVFYVLTAQRFGYEIADRVVRIQVESLRKVSEDLGNQYQIGIEQIRKNIVDQSEKPYIVEVDGKRIEMPVEYLIAMEFLVRGKEAPFRIEPEEFKAGNMPKMSNVDWALAECLAHGRQSAQNFFQPVAEKTRIVP